MVTRCTSCEHALGRSMLLVGACLQFACAADKPEHGIGGHVGQTKARLGDEGAVALVPARPGSREVDNGQPLVCNAGGAASPVRLRWVAVNVESTTALSTSIENTTSSEVVVRPKLKMHSPRGDFRELELSPVVVPADQIASLTLPLEDLPVQSRGLASTATLSIEWRQRETSIGVSHEEVSRPGELFAARTETPTQYVTLASDGQSAAVRGLPAQEDFERVHGTEVRLDALALADEHGVQQPVPEDELASSPVAAIGEADMEVVP